MKDLQIKKLYYSISEVSKMVGLEPYVLRYWETEFEQLRPQKNRAGNRIYTERDIDTIRLIKKLTREERYTNEGARQILTQMAEPSDKAGQSTEVSGSRGSSDQTLAAVRAILVKMRGELIEPMPAAESGGQ